MLDSSPIIGLANIGRLDLIRMLFHDIVIPPAVAYEVRGVKLPDRVTVVPLQKPVPDSVLRPALGRGETEAISLALEIRSERIILDDAAARLLAAAHGLRVVGLLGVLLIAKNLNFITDVRSNVDALRAASFWVSPQVYRHLLSQAGES